MSSENRVIWEGLGFCLFLNVRFLRSTAVKEGKNF